MVTSVDEWILLTARAEALVEAEKPELLASLEAEFGFDQQTAVAHLLESTDWRTETFPQYQGGKGLFAERLAALRNQWSNWKNA